MMECEYEKKKKTFTFEINIAEVPAVFRIDKPNESEMKTK